MSYQIWYFYDQIYRHGARAPDDTYPTDPNQEDAWPGGWGSLTQVWL